MSNPCSQYTSILATLISSVGELPEPSDYTLCLDYQQAGAQSEEACSRGYTFVPVKSGLGGVCVGSCRKGDTQVIRTFRNMPFMDMRHDIDLPVCQVAALGERGVKARGTRAVGIGSIIQIVIWVLLITWVIKQFRSTVQ